MERIGVVGLGSMGGALAANLVASGHDVVAHDVAGPERRPHGAVFVWSVGELRAEPTWSC